METKPTLNKKRNREYGNKGNAPPKKKRRKFPKGYNRLSRLKKHKPTRTRISAKGKRKKCRKFMEDLQDALQIESIDLMKLPEFSECDVGIQHFIADDSKAPKPIIASFKHKYEDFIVSEIDESGKVVKFTNNELITDDRSANIMDIESQSDIYTNVEAVYRQLLSLVTMGKAQKFIHWFKKSTQSLRAPKNTDYDKKEEEDFIIVTVPPPEKAEIAKPFLFDECKDKEKRTKIHTALQRLPHVATKTNHGSSLHSSCIEARIIKAKVATQRWSSRRGAYLKFVLVKCGMDNQHCLRKIGDKLRVNSKTFSIAGMKDKHAVTSQVATAWHVTAAKLNKAVSGLHNVRVGNFEYVADEIQLGCSLGNEFNIALRNVRYLNEGKAHSTVQESELKDRLDILSNTGFINYFGMQRFGASRVGTHLVGRAIFAKKLDLALALLILPRAGENGHFSKRRNEFVASGDIKDFPHELGIEKRCIKNLVQFDSPNSVDYGLVFMRMATRTRSMYTHSYQSYIWNHCVSERIKKYGYEAVIGDIVRLKEKKDVTGEDVNCNFEYLTQANIDQYDIFDVVFPLASPNIMLPRLEDVVKCMHDLLERDGLALKSFNKMDVWGVTTNYRNILAKATNIEGVVKKYRHHEELLMDVPNLGKRLIKKEKEKEQNVDDNMGHDEDDDMEHDDGDNKGQNEDDNKEQNDDDMDQDEDEDDDMKQDDDGKKRKKRTAWIVSLQLEKSCYATMCLRQLLFISSDKLKK